MKIQTIISPNKSSSIFLLVAIIFILSFFNIAGFSQTLSFYVTPFQTDSSYSTTEDSSLIVRNTVTNNNKLVIFLGGGYSTPGSYWAFCYKAATLSFDAISLCYSNQTGVGFFAEYPDSLIFDKIRQELCFGTPVCDSVSVDTLHSIRVRLIKLIQYLELNFPSLNWGQYLTIDNEPDWSKIILAGHSLGSGNAAYLAKHFNVDRVLMFSGPNDYSTFFNQPAPWLSNPGITDTHKYFSYLSVLDELVPFERQYSSISALGLLTNDDTTFVDYTVPPYSNSHCLYTTQPPGLGILYHNSTTLNSPINQPVWEYMLTSDSIPSKAPVIITANKTWDVYPNPAINMFTITGTLNSSEEFSVNVYSVNGKLCFQKSDITDAYGNFNLKFNFSNENLKNGIYIISLLKSTGIETTKMIKQ